MNNIEITDTGLVCDNPNCDWKDETITFDIYHEWLNKPCPKCGENVLTEEDFLNAENLHSTINFINSLSEEQLEILSKEINGGEIVNSEIMKDVVNKDLSTLTENLNDTYKVVIDTHKELKIKSIEKID